jgi:hypothetical protein
MAQRFPYLTVRVRVSRSQPSRWLVSIIPKKTIYHPYADDERQKYSDPQKVRSPGSYPDDRFPTLAIVRSVIVVFLLIPCFSGRPPPLRIYGENPDGTRTLQARTSEMCQIANLDSTPSLSHFIYLRLHRTSRVLNLALIPGFVVTSMARDGTVHYVTDGIVCPGL